MSHRNVHDYFIFWFRFSFEFFSYISFRIFIHMSGYWDYKYYIYLKAFFPIQNEWLLLVCMHTILLWAMIGWLRVIANSIITPFFSMWFLFLLFSMEAVRMLLHLLSKRTITLMLMLIVLKRLWTGRFSSHFCNFFLFSLKICWHVFYHALYC